MRDLDVRIAVRERLWAEHDGDRETRIVEEMGLWSGAVRVDLAVINGELGGYEIKSARDTLSRLPGQASLYNAVFDRVFLVAAEKHVVRALRQIPEWWGLIVASDKNSTLALTELRRGEVNPSVEPLQIARLLWREETLTILEARQAARGVRSAARDALALRLVESLPLDELRYEVRLRLKQREAWLGQPVGHE